MNNRRDFLVSMGALPILATTGFGAVIPKDEQTAKGFGHKFKLSLNCYSFNKLLKSGKLDLFDILDFCAEYNFDAIDPNFYYFGDYPKVPSDELISSFKQKAFRMGIEISGGGMRKYFTHTDQKLRASEVSVIKDWVVAASKLGMSSITVFAQKSDYDTTKHDHFIDSMAKDLRECCAFGQKYGVMISVQNHNNLIKTADHVDQLFKAVDSKWLGLTLDTANYRQSDPYKETEKTAHLAVAYQIKENVKIGGESQPTDLVKLAKIIKNSGYRGYLLVETLGKGDPFVKVPRLLENLKDALLEVGA